VAVSDPIAAFYDRHPYPPPVGDLDALASASAAGGGDRVGHHLIWPSRGQHQVGSLLVAGCGTSQAARHALRNPGVDVVGIDVSATSIEHTQRLIRRHGITNLTTHLLPIEQVAELGHRFDHVVCTGVLHHLAEPATGLRALRNVLAPRGALTLMVYARYGRVGIEMIQAYARLLAISTDPAEVADLVATLRELPSGHPISRLLRETRDFLDDDALADALLNPRERSYTVPELFELVDGAGLRFGRWAQQAPYLPDCGSMSETPHASRIAALEPREQYAAMELFRGTLDRHTAILFGADDETSGRVDFSRASELVPIVRPGSTAVDDGDRLPPGAAAALLNRSHPANDLVMFVDAAELAMFRAIDGRRPVRDLGRGAAAFVERLWRHDLVVVDATEQR
jgi:SAM-dependent methyltransferase